MSSDPEDGAEVSQITGLTLTFNNDPLDVNPVISISGPDGQEKALEVTPVVDGRDVYVEFSDLEPGEYAVSWRVVSSDGHPIEGNQTFTVLPDPDAEEPADEEPAEDPNTSVSSDDEGVDRIDADESDSESPANDGAEEEDAAEAETTSADLDDETDDSSGISTWVWLALIVVAALIGVYIGRVTKKTAHDTNDQTPPNSK